MLQSSSPRPTIASLLSADTIPIISNLLFSSDSTTTPSAQTTAQNEHQKSVTFAEPEIITKNYDSPSQIVHNDKTAEAPENFPSSVRNADNLQHKSSDETNKKSKALKPKTIYSLAYPHPTRWQKLHIRPRKYLQLQQWIDNSSRPVPAYEIVPATCFSTVSRKANAKFQRMSRWRNCFGPDEMFVTRAGDYTSAANAAALADTASSSSDESTSSIVQDPGAAVAAICAVSARRRNDGVVAELALDDETVWEATPIANGGGYEFTWTDEHGLRRMVRWVARGSKSKPRQRRSGSWAGITQTSGKEIHAAVNDRAVAEKRFIFSIIDPHSRRHPVVASLTNSCMEVYDSYTQPTPKLSSNNGPSSSDLAKESDCNAETQKLADSTDGESVLSTSSSPLHHTDEQTRKLILVSGIWVALQEGWSPNFRYSRSGLPAASLLARSSSSASTMPNAQNSAPAQEVATVATSTPAKRSRFSSCPSTPSTLSQAAEPVVNAGATPTADNSVMTSTAATPATLTKPATTIPSSFASSENCSPTKTSRRSMMRRASTQLLLSSRHSTTSSAFETEHGIVCTTPKAAEEHRQLQCFQLINQPCHVQSPPQVQIQHQCTKDSGDSTGISKNSTRVSAGASVVSVPSTTATPVVSAQIVPAAYAPHQPRKINRIVRGLLVGAVNKMDKRAGSTAVANVSATGILGYGKEYDHRNGFGDGSGGGGVSCDKNFVDVAAKMKDVKAERRRTIM